MNGIRRALLFTSAERYVTLGANFLTLSIISRLLTPAEIGVSVLGIAVIALSQSARHFAEPIYLVQHKQLLPAHVRSFITLQTLVTLAIFMVVTISAPLIARAYATPELQPYLRVVSVCILAQAISEPIAALMRREMAFAKLALINIFGVIVNSALSVILVLYGYSFMSIAWASLSSAIAIALLSLAMRRDLSIFKPCLNEWREVVSFGGYNGANMLFYRFYETIPSLILGSISSVDAVALYNRSITICQLPDKFIMGGASAVVLPAFSSGVRQGEDLRGPYLRSIEYITALHWPAFLVLAILAHPIVHLVLGDQWVSVVPLVQIIAVASLFAFSAELNYPVLVAVGGIRDVFFRSLIVWPISALVVVAGAFLGLRALAYSWLVIVPFQAYVSVQFVRNWIHVSWGDIARATRKGAVVAACSACGPLAVIFAAGSFSISIPAAVVAIVLSALGWATGVWLSKHPLWLDAQYGLSAIRHPGTARRAESISISLVP